MEKNKKYKEVVINTCYGGFGLSDEAYEELIKLGIPVKRYNPKDNDNNKKVIYDNELIPKGEDKWQDEIYWNFKGITNSTQRYWDVWTQYDRENPLIIKVVKKLGERANGHFAKLKIVRIPADVEYEIEEYDGMEWIAEKHRTWS